MMQVLVRVNWRDGEGRRWRRAAARLALCAALAFAATAARAQEDVPPDEREFGPVVRAYLGYLRAEQLVTDDRASRREVSPAYVRRNSNRVRALRQMALRIARETKNDYLPELYAVARDELHTLFETPPRPEAFREGEILNDTFRYLGPVRTGELFYLFARLDIYEQAELLKQHGGGQTQPAHSATRTGDVARPAGAATEPAEAEAQLRKTTEKSSATQTKDAGRNGAQGDGARPADVASPATRPRRVPPPAAERPPAPEQQR
jgi:hypothetical protein